MTVLKYTYMNQIMSVTVKKCLMNIFNFSLSVVDYVLIFP